MNLETLGRHWQEFGRRDPFWAVLTHPDKAGGRWTPEEFYATGRADVDNAREWLRSLGQPVHWRTALDFGCGAGRLTRALGASADAVTGVDIAESMIEVARRHTPEPNCRYIHNATPDLSQFAGESFDLVYSRLVLQHIQPRYIRGYLREFVRVLTSDGIAVFQLPVRPVEPPVAQVGLKQYAPMPLVVAYRRLRRALQPDSTFPRMESWGLDREEAEQLVAAAGGAVVAVRPCSTGQVQHSWEYVVRRPVGRSGTSATVGNR